MAALDAFHQREKLLLMACASEHLLQRLLDATSNKSPKEVRDRYAQLFLAAIARPTTGRMHVEVLRHIASRFRGELAEDSLRELHAMIREYRRGRIGLNAVLALVRQHVNDLGLEPLQQQTYLSA